MTALNAVSTQISQSLSLEQVALEAVQSVLYATQASTAFLLMREGDDLVPAQIAFSEPDREFSEYPTHKLGACLCGMAVSERKAIFSADISKDPRCSWDECKRAGLRSVVALPLFRGDEIFAVLGLGADTVRDFESQAEFLETLASEIANGLQNALLYEQVQSYAATLEQRVEERTERLKKIVGLMAGREVRMAELKGVIKKLRTQLEDAGMIPVADDPLLAEQDNQSSG
jgi:GAF domain-containing protein